MAQDPVFVQRAFQAIAPRYQLANHVLSAGIDIAWRRRTGRVVQELEPGRILDLATGTGDLALELQRRCPQTRVVAADFCPEMLEIAKRNGVAETLVADAMQLPFDDASFDVVTVAFGLRNMASWPGAAREMRRVLGDGGHLVILDFSLPKGPFREPYRYYLHRVLPRVAGWIAGNREAYEYLGGSIERFPSGRAMEDLLQGAGFASARTEPLTGGVASLYVASV